MYAGRQNADDRVRLSVHPDLSTEDVAVLSKMPAPQSVAEYDHVIPAGLTLFRQEIAPQHHGQAFHREKPGCPL